MTSVLAAPRHPLIEYALTDAQRWCEGHIIDGRPALAHATQVAATLAAHEPGIAPDIVAAALLHDSPDFVPAGFDLDGYLTARYSAETTRVVRALQAEHRALDSGAPAVLIDDQPVLLVSTADKIVALRSLLRRAAASGDTTAFFSQRAQLLDLVPHFSAFHLAAAPLIPAGLADALGGVVTDLVVATAAARRSRP
ncbi:metal-dependent phosphohydrolase [Catenuloplanes atrovinosus]|uniref:(P)ppGpp synthase/HD superfamily hydrolase n=1 Tax=Catenuloplanes atrovinosus TaxID=137266 RepID=A0AAE3YSN8_9ACTN|nr:metal-dependent phosphohydrolase [Catenuloplanes atrovinosus]MDR7277713.1 (p)ppGpp synthase/HD superfamily hydrolase [Catenuloplanes atrovinosus]